jgi:hypothetical protein
MFTVCYSEVCDFMHIRIWAIRSGTSMYPFIWPHILRYFHQVLIWTVWVHKVFKDDFEEIVIQGDQLWSCCNQMGFFGKRSNNAGEKKRDLEKQCGIWGWKHFIYLVTFLAWKAAKEVQDAMRHNSMRDPLWRCRRECFSSVWLFNLIPGWQAMLLLPQHWHLVLLGFEYPGVLSLNENVTLVS